MYNANDLGFYRGGVPKKGRGSIRGTAMGRPGEFHQPAVHNFLNYYHPDSKTITSEDTMKFKAFMQSDKDDFNLTRPSHPVYHDKNMEFLKDRSFWLALTCGLLGLMYGVNRYHVEVKRAARTERLSMIEDLPGHHFNNRGGVLIKKQFAGFEKYHKNVDEMMAWY